jgi:hypothetical protein
MTDPNAIARDYLALWNDTDDGSRRSRLSSGWAPEARYSDPMMCADGLEDVAAMIAGTRTKFPGHTFVLRRVPDGHGSFVRFSWTLEMESGAVVGGGTDIVRLNDDGRVAEVIGFLDGEEA